MPQLVVVRHRSVDAGLTALLSPGDRERFASFRGDEALEQRFLAGREALRAAAARVGEPDIVIDARCPDCGLSHGRPTARGASRSLFLTLTHCEGMAMAIGMRRPVGIDAEPLRISAERRAAIDELAPGRGDALERWTAIEAVLKADGRGLRVPPDTVRLGIRGARLDSRRYRLRILRREGCVVTIAIERPGGTQDRAGSAV